MRFHHIFIIGKIVINAINTTWFFVIDNCFTIASCHAQVSRIISSFLGAIWWIVYSCIFIAKWLVQFMSIVILNVPDRIQIFCSTCKAFINITYIVAKVIWYSSLPPIFVSSPALVSILTSYVIESLSFCFIKTVPDIHSSTNKSFHVFYSISIISETTNISWKWQTLLEKLILSLLWWIVYYSTLAGITFTHIIITLSLIWNSLFSCVSLTQECTGRMIWFDWSRNSNFTHFI